MNDQDLLAEYLPANEAEYRALEEQLQCGALNPLLDHLIDFPAQHREDITQIANDPGNPSDLLIACKLLIVEAGGVHPQVDLHDQLRAIHDEIWYRGERGEYDRDFIIRDWISRHASAWRKWRIKTYFFLVDKFATEIFSGCTSIHRVA